MHDASYLGQCGLAMREGVQFLLLKLARRRYSACVWFSATETNPNALVE